MTDHDMMETTLPAKWGTTQEHKVLNTPETNDEEERTALKTLLGHLARDNETDAMQCWREVLKDLMEDVAAEGRELQRKKQKLITKQRNETMEQMKTQKISNLFKAGTRGIQRAMGKEQVVTEMTALQSTHPDTALFLIPSGEREGAEARMHALCTLHVIATQIRTYKGLMWVTVTTHTQLTTLLEIAAN